VAAELLVTQLAFFLGLATSLKTATEINVAAITVINQQCQCT